MTQIIKKNEVILPELSYRLVDIFFAVHNKLGRYLNEKQYVDALENILVVNNIRYVREKPLPVLFVGERPNRNIPDFIIETEIVVDPKAKRIITKEDYFQMNRYLVSYKKKLGIIVNFRQLYLSPKRVLNSQI